ncbi:hypothetical protein BR93DRAFT_965611 [Coniochaeta sp. PMI_546]|nr:hypothetical protein BR93DRAFT_965611 [Coniochaeta sp. PMI_546]
MPDSILFSPAPYHILSYGTLLGTTFFHSFVNGIVAFKVLDRPHFAALQSRLFPIYFSMQTAIPVVLALTYPGSRSVLGGNPAGIAGVIDAGNRWSVLAPLATIFLTGLANLAVVGPATTKTMRDRKTQERKDGKKSYDPPPHSQEMLKLNKKFGKLHGISSLLNLTTFIASIIYGITLSARIE